MGPPETLETLETLETPETPKPLPSNFSTRARCAAAAARPPMPGVGRPGRTTRRVVRRVDATVVDFRGDGDVVEARELGPGVGEEGAVVGADRRSVRPGREPESEGWGGEGRAAGLGGRLSVRCW